MLLRMRLVYSIWDKGTEFKDDRSHRYLQGDRPSLPATIYLFVIQQTISRWETDVMVGF